MLSTVPGAQEVLETSEMLDFYHLRDLFLRCAYLSSSSCWSLDPGFSTVSCDKLIEGPRDGEGELQALKPPSLFYTLGFQSMFGR